MQDHEIIELYFERNETAIAETKNKYERYLYAIAWRVLGVHEDCEEVMNDTYIGAWNAIPPHRPESFSTFLGKITRNLSLKKYRARTTEKRGGGILPMLLDEMDQSLAAEGRVEERIEAEELAKAIRAFLETLDEEERSVFLCRYWYFDTIQEIAKRYAFTQSKVKMMLKRTRDRLMQYLKREEIVQ